LLPISAPSGAGPSGEAGRVFANLGAGPNRGPPPPIFAGWREFRVDIEPQAHPDLVADLTDLSAIADGAVDGVWCSHAIEHVYAHQTPIVLSEMRRILSPDGIAVVLTPDLQAVARVVAEDRLHEVLYTSPAGPITAHDVMYGLGSAIAAGHVSMAHRCGFTPTVLINAFRAGGFENFVVFRRGPYELAALARRSAWPSEAEREAQLGMLRP
jgi:SAM-dependent methyltransferase